MRRAKDESAPQTLTEAIAHLMALPIQQFDDYVPRSVAERIACQIIRQAQSGDADSLAAIIRIALTDKSKSRSGQATKITVVEE